MGSDTWYGLTIEHKVIPVKAFFTDDFGKMSLTEDGDNYFTWWENFKNRQVDRTAVAPGIEVSTVFLGADHSFGDGPPVVFETMIFGGKNDGYQFRYSTWDEALEGHAVAVELAKEAL